MDLNVRDVARLLDVSEDTVMRWARQGRLAARRWDDQYRFNRVELHECARALGRPVPPDVFPTGDASLPAVAAALERGGIHHGVDGTRREEVLTALANLSSIPPEVERQRLAQLLVAREKLASTGIGGGIAVPHARDPLVVRVAAPVLVLGFLTSPVDFQAPDGQPVRAVFVLLSPTTRLHLQALAAIMFALHDEEFSGLLHAQADADAILARARLLDDRSAARRP